MKMMRSILLAATVLACCAVGSLRAQQPAFNPQGGVYYADVLGGQQASGGYASYLAEEGISGCDSCASCVGGGCDGGCTGACLPGCGCACGNCAGSGIWGSVDYLMWWAKGRNLPPLVTTSPTNPLEPQITAGVLPPFGNADILFGGGAVGTQVQSGGRVDLGTWLQGDEMLGVGLRVFGLEGTTDRIDRQSVAGDPILGVPFFDVLLNRENALLVAYPGFTNGNLSVVSDSDFWSSEGYGRIFFDRGSNYRVDLILGYHFAKLDDSLTNRFLINDNLNRQFDIRDRFVTKNEFNGGQIGFLHEGYRGIWSLKTLAKISVGEMNQRVGISGSTVITQGGIAGPALPGGFFALPSNIGTYERNHTVVIPELAITLGVQLTPRLKANFGYTGLWLSDVALAGDQVDRRLNLTQAQGGNLVGQPVPGFQFRTTDFWLQGMNFGLTWDY